MIEAPWMKARKLRPGFSYRVATRRNCLIRLMNRLVFNIIFLTPFIARTLEFDPRYSQALCQKGSYADFVAIGITTA